MPWRLRLRQSAHRTAQKQNSLATGNETVFRSRRWGAMPRYFFHCNGSDDTEGLELPDDATAREQAREAFGALIQQGDDCPNMEVVDADGRRVVKLSFRVEP